MSFTCTKTRPIIQAMAALRAACLAQGTAGIASRAGYSSSRQLPSAASAAPVAPYFSTSLRSLFRCNELGQKSYIASSRQFKAFSTTAEYAGKEEGEPNSFDYRIFFSDASGKKVSPWHDIPLKAGDGLFNMICEIPRESSAKMEIATDEPLTPIKQDTKKGKLRFYPYNINWNYGLLPQTWEDPTHSNPEVESAFGDNDPVDVVEISSTTAKMGEVYKVKPLGVLAMIDEGELDWKVIAIRADDSKAGLVHDIDSVEKEFPGTLTAIRDWFRDYKIPDGKPANKFGLDNKAAGKSYALKVIEETHESWGKLVKRSVPAGDLSLV